MSAAAEHKLAAILSADVVGYSRLMAEDEDDTVRRLSAYRTEVANLVGEHRGRVVDFTGDNFLAEFPTATDAVGAAAEIQRVIRARNAALPAGRAMEFRIGVHLGEVRVEGERLYGTGVNVAARLQGLADASGICVSGTVAEQIRGKLAFDFDDLGEQKVRNIPDPVHAYRLRERAVEASTPPRRGMRRALAVGAIAALGAALAAYLALRAPSPTGAPITAIAVLPFHDMSPAGDSAWLGDGMAEELIDALSRIEALRVIARTSAFAHRGEDVSTIGEKLQVGAVVEGSVRRSGDQLRVTAQLIRVGDQSHLWSASYDRGLSDVFALQREIAREVAEAVRTELGVSETQSWLIDSRYATPDIRAWEFVKQGVDREQTYSAEGFRDEIALTLQALEIDPDYAQAHAQLGWGHFFLWYSGLDAREETRAKARSMAERAIELEPTNGAAQNLLAWMSMGEADWAGAEARYARALRDTPSHGPLREGYGIVLLATGRLEEAETQLERAIALDPETAGPRSWLGRAYLGRRDFDAAIAEFERALVLFNTLWLLSYAHHLRGDDARAAEVLLESAPSAVAAAWRQAFEEQGYGGIVRAGLEHEIAASGTPCTRLPTQAASMLAVLGEPDRMLACLDEAIRQKRPPVDVKSSPAYDPYRGDPRFIALLERMHLAE
jgi:adenylate cyclase